MAQLAKVIGGAVLLASALTANPMNFAHASTIASNISQPIEFPVTKLPPVDIKKVAVCKRILSRNKSLGIGCFVAHYTPKAAAEALKAFGWHEVAKEVERLAEHALEALRKAYEEKEVNSR